MRAITAISLFVVLLLQSVTAQESLRKYADALGLNIGVAIKDSYISGTDAISTTHNAIVKTQFNTVVCENAMKANDIAPTKTSYNFSPADKVVDFAVANKMKIRGHTLVWYFQNASWLTKGPRDTLLANMKYHIQQEVGHYKGKLYQWDVVNEPFAEDGTFRTINNPWQTIIGDDYIDSAFVYAHAADPDAKLYINEYTTTFPGPKADALYAKVKKMLANGIPVQGVGFQCHEKAVQDLAAAGVAEGFAYSLKRFAALGVELAVTELDLESGDPVSQAANYATYLRVVLAVPQCKTFVLWGVSDKDSWRASGTPLIYDRNFAAKPAYDSLLAVLKKASTETVPADCHKFDAPLRRGTLHYDRVSNTLSLLTSPWKIDAVLCELFDLRGVKTAVFSLHPEAVVPLASFKHAEGSFIIRSGHETLLLGGVRR